MSKTSAAKAKGLKGENDVVDHYIKNGLPCERRVKHGKNDKGDVLVYTHPNYVVEVKNCKTMKLAEWVEELKTEVINADATDGVLVVKRPRKPVGEAYAIMTLDMYLSLRFPDSVKLE